VTAAENFEIELFRHATPQHRSQLALWLSARKRTRVQRAIEHAYPELSPWAQKVKLVEVEYGADLARRFERWLIERGRLTP